MDTSGIIVLPEDNGEAIVNGIQHQEGYPADHFLSETAKGSEIDGSESAKRVMILSLCERTSSPRIDGA